MARAKGAHRRNWPEHVKAFARELLSAGIPVVAVGQVVEYRYRVSVPESVLRRWAVAKAAAVSDEGDMHVRLHDALEVGELVIRLLVQCRVMELIPESDAEVMRHLLGHLEKGFAFFDMGRLKTVLGRTNLGIGSVDEKGPESSDDVSADSSGEDESGAKVSRLDFYERMRDSSESA